MIVNHFTDHDRVIDAAAEICRINMEDVHKRMLRVIVQGKFNFTYNYLPKPDFYSRCLTLLQNNFECT
jgi:hypothetical protein